jgi:hypothetical protein
VTPSRSLWSPETMARDTKLSLCRTDPNVGQAVCCWRLRSRLCGGIRAGLLMRHTLYMLHTVDLTKLQGGRGSGRGREGREEGQLRLGRGN